MTLHITTDTDRASDVEHEREEADRARVHAALAELEALANDRGAWSPSDAITHVDRAEELYGMLCRTVYRDGAADCLACVKDRALDVLIAAQHVLIAAQHVRDAAQRRADADLVPPLALMREAGALRDVCERTAMAVVGLMHDQATYTALPVAWQRTLRTVLRQTRDVLARCPAVEGE